MNQTNQCECGAAALTASMEIDLSTCHYFDATHVGDVEAGVQTKAQISRWFGKPDSVTALVAGGERWVYTSAQVGWSGQGYQPRALAIDFDAAGMVRDHAYSEFRLAA